MLGRKHWTTPGQKCIRTSILQQQVLAGSLIKASLVPGSEWFCEFSSTISFVTIPEKALVWSRIRKILHVSPRPSKLGNDRKVLLRFRSCTDIGQLQTFLKEFQNRCCCVPVRFRCAFGVRGGPTTLQGFESSVFVLALVLLEKLRHVLRQVCLIHVLILSLQEAMFKKPSEQVAGA